MSEKRMIRIVVLFWFGCFVLCRISAQEIVPSLEWERLYHDSACNFSSVAQTDDGGYIMGGTIYGVELDPGGCILVKISSQGEVQWQRIYGSEGIRSVRQTTDGGYVFAAVSTSPPSTNKTSPHFGLKDAWVVKVDAQGNKQWDQSFGGTGEDSAASIWQTTDGGFILAGDSSSAPSGNKESRNFGISDAWIVKMDAQGNKQWDRSFGGESNDIFTSLVQTADGDYAVAGTSYSPPSGDGDAPHSDGWLMKVDAEGNKQWERFFGGTADEIFLSLDRTTDGGVILGGRSDSPPSGNKESPHFGGFFDYWLIKVDAAGNKQWDRSYGTATPSVEEVRVVRQTMDQGYIFGGYVGGNSRLVKVDAQGRQQWDQTLGKPADPDNAYIVEINDLQQTKDGGCVLGGRFDLPNAGPPPSGCTWGSWAAKFENVVSRAGEVLGWPAEAGVVLESVDDLNGEWRADSSEMLSIGGANAIAFVPSGQRRYYRLHAAGSSNDVPSLSISALLSWPVAANQALEFSTKREGPWDSFPGDQGSVGTNRYAIIPQSLKDHYFRTRTVD